MDCPDDVTDWMVASDTGWLGNRYVTSQCFYSRLLDPDMMEFRLKNFTTDKIAMIRYFDHSQGSNDGHEDWENFFEVFKNLPEYNSKFTVNQGFVFISTYFSRNL
jgi:predicted SnoaL-like aldol condensation-catalyzing enzyme